MKFFLLFFLCTFYISAQEFEVNKLNDRFTIVSTTYSDNKILKETKKLKLSNIIYLDNLPTFKFLEETDFEMVWDVSGSSLNSIYELDLEFKENNTYYLIEDRNQHFLTISIFFYDNIQTVKPEVIKSLKKDFDNISHSNDSKDSFGRVNMLKGIPEKINVKIPFSKDNYYRLIKWIDDNKEKFDVVFQGAKHPERYSVLKLKS